VLLPVTPLKIASRPVHAERCPATCLLSSRFFLQEKALLALSALLDHNSAAISAAALEGALPALAGLAARLRGSLTANGGEEHFAQDVLLLVQQVQQRVEAQLAQRRRTAEL
jgi:hypothetical protein